MDIRNHIELGREIQQVRVQRGLTQATLAAQAGVSRRWLAQVESGHPGAQIDKIFSVLNALGLGVQFAERVEPDNGEPLHTLVANQEW